MITYLCVVEFYGQYLLLLLTSRSYIIDLPLMKNFVNTVVFLITVIIIIIIIIIIILKF